MNCDRIQERLEEYLDGELVAAECRMVDAHLAGCAACAAVLEGLETESAIYTRYDRGFEPGPEMWDAVLSRIESEGVGRVSLGSRVREWLGRAGALVTPGRLVPVCAGALAILVTASVAFVLLRNESQRVATNDAGSQPTVPEVATGPSDGLPEVGGPRVTTTQPDADADQERKARPSTVRRPSAKGGTTSAPILPAKLAAVERDYLKAIAVLTKDVTRIGPGLDPQVRKPLADIDQNIVTARQAVQKNPDDPVAVLNMISAYDEKVEVLQTLARFQADRNR